MLTKFLCYIGLHERDRIRDSEGIKDFCVRCGKELQLKISGEWEYSTELELVSEQLNQENKFYDWGLEDI